ncbi:MAG: branched-chain amino acid ABC transporter permease [Pseudomonadota bacterium]|nr:branched-chain amino acid ABC transporter permease [Pseudomonadota bacterium]
MSEVLLQQLVNGLSVGFGYALVALGLTLAFGVLHVINFAHGEIVMLGALSMVVAGKLGIPYVAALPLAAVVGVLVGWLVNAVAVEPLLPRADGRTDILLTTFALGVLANQLVLSTWGPAPARVEGIPGAVTVGALSLSGQRLFIIGASLVTLVVLERVLTKTRFGVEMRAIAQSSHAARVVGIDIRRVGRRTFLLAAGIAGFGGALLAPITSYSPLLGQAVLLKAFVIVVLGGLGSPFGAVVCALLVGVLEAGLSLFFPEAVTAMVVYSLMILTLLVRPAGLLGRSL